MTPRELAGALGRQLNPRRARWQRPAVLVRALRLRRGETVAEIGCGPGYFTARLARAVGPAGHVFAVDPEPAVLDIMRRRLRGVRNVTPVLGREDDPLLPRGRCRTAVLINVYHHMHGGTAFLRRLVISLPRDARVINVDWNETSEFGPPPRQRVPRTRFLRDARRAGLRLVTTRTIPAVPVLPDPAPSALSAAGWSSPRAAAGASPSRSPEGLISGRSARSSEPSTARALKIRAVDFEEACNHRNRTP
jgi:SAM-dependent methyltransferase